MKKLTGHEIGTWQLSAHEVEVLTDAADQKDEDKNSLFLDFDESTLLIENCDGEFFMCIFEQGKGIERVFLLLQATGMYKVMCGVGPVAFDYSKIRTSDTELTEEEQGYCYNDVRALSVEVIHMQTQVSNQTLNNVTSYDIASSYPACMIGDDTIEAEFTGFVHETWEGAERELDEAMHHPAVRCAWIEAI